MWPYSAHACSITWPVPTFPTSSNNSVPQPTLSLCWLQPPHTRHRHEASDFEGRSLCRRCPYTLDSLQNFKSLSRCFILFCGSYFFGLYANMFGVISIPLMLSCDHMIGWSADWCEGACEHTFPAIICCFSSMALCRKWAILLHSLREWSCFLTYTQRDTFMRIKFWKVRIFLHGSPQVTNVSGKRER